MFYLNSDTETRDIRDGLSNTIAVGERSSSIFDSAWAGVASGSDHAGWRVIGWTGETPNQPIDPIPLLNCRGVAQFNSMHAGGATMFSFADGSSRSISDRIDPQIFLALGTIHGRDRVTQ